MRLSEIQPRKLFWRSLDHRIPVASTAKQGSNHGERKPFDAADMATTSIFYALMQDFV
ncbi:MAG: hypothetical protein OXE78_02295 [Gammaproteobacteria bacterium]|nr:hypothetical protein [Gammaproteobacteria bacterium]